MGEGHPGGPWRALTLVAVRQEEGARAQVVVVEAVDGHGRVLARAAPEPAHGGRRGARACLLPSVRPPAQPQPIPKRPRPAPAYQGRAQPFKGAVAGGCLVTVGVVKGQP